jgi:hypothetical protein
VIRNKNAHLCIRKSEKLLTACGTSTQHRIVQANLEVPTMAKKKKAKKAPKKAKKKKR